MTRDPVDVWTWSPRQLIAATLTRAWHMGWHLDEVYERWSEAPFGQRVYVLRRPGVAKGQAKQSDLWHFEAPTKGQTW